MKITIVTVSNTAIRELIKAEKAINSQFENILKLSLHYAGDSKLKEETAKMRSDIATADAVLVDLMGSPADNVKAVNEALKECKGHIIPYGQSGRSQMRLGKLTTDSMKMGKSEKKPGLNQMDPGKMRRMADMAEKTGKLLPMGKMKDMRNLSQISKYFRMAEYSQLLNMLYLILRDYGGHMNLPKPEDAREAKIIGICEPYNRSYYKDFKDYAAKCSHDDNRPTVALLYYGHSYPDDTSPCAARIVEKLREKTNVLPIACGGTAAENYTQMEEWLIKATGRPVDIILNLMSFRLGAGPMGGDAEGAVSLLKKINAPYLHPFVMTRRKISEWQRSAQGLNSSEFLISVMLPELDGSIESLPIGAMSEPFSDEATGIKTRKLTPINERMEKLAFRVNGLIKLRQKENKDKRVAIIGYNYPPGEDNIFGGSFLDTFESISNMLCTLKSEGYETEDLSAEELMQEFCAGRICNSGRYADGQDYMQKYPVAKYAKHFDKVKQKSTINEQWGAPPGKIMAGKHGDFLIPGIECGNVFVGLQPSRGIHEDVEKAYHDKELMPHHQYIAFYTWLKEEFKADAVIHVGTHGTIEFLSGKECGMSGDCFPDRLISDMPHMYLYYVGNPAEAMIAKRRSHANIISYQPPQYLQGELYDEYVNLSASIDEYHEALRVSPARSDDILSDIKETAAGLNLPTELEELERELYRMHRSLIPSGLHVFGKGYDEKESLNYVKSLLRYDRGEVKSLRRIAAEDSGADYDAILEENNTKELALLDEKADLIFNSSFNGGKSNIKNNNLKKELALTIEYGKNILHDCRFNEELGGLIRTLNGEYNPAKLAGDIFRNPEVMPTGFNLYQFDPRFVPSPTACTRGKKIAENTLKRYEEEHGELPASTAVVLWGLETSRTQGETVAQILTYLGVEVTRTSNIWEPGYRIIPLEELGRKRVDVVVNMCGFFRDMFPNVMDSLNKVFEDLAALDEPSELNTFKANTKKIYETLTAQGYGKEEAEELSRSRIFGPGEGQYGTGITGIIETKNWETEEQIGENFVQKLRYVYSKNFRGRDVDGLLNNNLKSVDIVSQTRSNHEYEITDLDHYYEFFGGLSKSVEMAKGKKAAMYITDTTGERIETERVEKSIGRGIRTRVLNPKWIDGMLKHKYHGVQKIVERFENVMGLAATTGKVEAWVYNDLYKKYAEDKEMQKRLKENNPYAYLSIIEQMLEYQKRGYWDATKEQLKTLKNLYLELEGNIEESLEDK